MSTKAGKHFVIKDSTEMRFEVIFCFDAHTRIYPKEPQNWSRRSKLKKKGRNWHKSAVPWVSAERIKNISNWPSESARTGSFKFSAAKTVWPSFPYHQLQWFELLDEDFVKTIPLQKQRSCEIGSRLKLWPLFVTKKPGIYKKAAGIRMIYMKAILLNKGWFQI